MADFVLFTDGGARGNPGPGAAGVILENTSGKIVREARKYLGECTNNEAEYSALIIGLKIANEASAKDIVCCLDSELLVRQLNGIYKVKSLNLKPFYEKVKTLEKSFDKVVYSHIARSRNSRADKLVNEVLDSV